MRSVMDSNPDRTGTEAPTDRDLVLRFRSGDETAFAGLVSRHKATVYRIVYRMLRNGDDAEEITQITFVKAFRSFHRFKEEFDFHPWLYRIAVNAALTHIDRRKRQRSVDIDVVPLRELRPGFGQLVHPGSEPILVEQRPSVIHAALSEVTRLMRGNVLPARLCLQIHGECEGDPHDADHRKEADDDEQRNSPLRIRSRLKAEG